MSNYGHIDYVQNPPYYKRLCNFEWVDDYLTLQDISQEIKFLQSKKSEIENAQSPKKTVKARFKASFEKYQQRRIERLARVLSKNMNGIDPFSSLEARAMGIPEVKRLIVPFSWEEVEQAIELMGFSDDPLDDAEKNKRLGDLKEAIDVLKVKMKEHSPSGYFIIRDGRVDKDTREELVNFWRTRQEKCRAACTPQGFDLESGTDAEKEAYDKLGISKYINPNRYAPDPNPRHTPVKEQMTLRMRKRPV